MFAVRGTAPCWCVSEQLVFYLAERNLTDFPVDFFVFCCFAWWVSAGGKEYERLQGHKQRQNQDRFLETAKYVVFGGLIALAGVVIGKRL